MVFQYVRSCRSWAKSRYTKSEQTGLVSGASEAVYRGVGEAEEVSRCEVGGNVVEDIGSYVIFSFNLYRSIDTLVQLTQVCDARRREIDGVAYPEGGNKCWLLHHSRPEKLGLWNAIRHLVAWSFNDSEGELEMTATLSPLFAVAIIYPVPCWPLTAPYCIHSGCLPPRLYPFPPPPPSWPSHRPQTRRSLPASYPPRSTSSYSRPQAICEQRPRSGPTCPC